LRQMVYKSYCNTHHICSPALYRTESIESSNDPCWALVWCSVAV
jgi:hypothetical protein